MLLCLCVEWKTRHPSDHVCTVFPVVQRLEFNRLPMSCFLKTPRNTHMCTQTHLDRLHTLSRKFSLVSPGRGQMPLRPSPRPGRALPLGWDRGLEMDGSPLPGTSSAPPPPSLRLHQAASFPITGRPQGPVRHRDFPQEPGPNMPSDSVWATFSVLCPLCPVLHKRDLMQSSRLFMRASLLCFTRHREGKRLALKNRASK